MKPFPILQPQVSNFFPVFLHHWLRAALLRCADFYPPVSFTIFLHQHMHTAKSRSPSEKMARETSNWFRNLNVLFILLFIWILLRHFTVLWGATFTLFSEPLKERKKLYFITKTQLHFLLFCLGCHISKGYKQGRIVIEMLTTQGTRWHVNSSSNCSLS